MKPETPIPRDAHSDSDRPAPAVDPQALPIVVYRPNYRHDMGWVESWVTMVRNTWGAREMIWQLMKRDITAQFKKSYVGITWMFVAPIMSIVPWLFATGVGLYDPGEVSVALPVYLLVGRSMWSLFMGFYANGSSALGSGGALLQQVNFPHEAMLTKQVLHGLTNYSLAFLVNVAAMVAYDTGFHWGALLYPLTMLPLFFLGAAMGLVLGMIKIVAYDLSRIIGMAMGFLMWTTPLLYGNKVPSPLLQQIIKWNPLTYLVCSARDVLLHGHVYEHELGIYLGCCGVSLVLFLIAMRLFFVSEHKLVERMI